MNNQNRKNNYRNYQSYNNNKKNSRKRSQDDLINNNEATSSAPNLPGFYYDEITQKYFKIGSNSFGVKSVITTHSISKKEEEEKFSVKNKTFSKNLINILNLYQLNGINQEIQQNCKDYLMKSSKPKKIMNITFYPKISEIQSLQIKKEIYFLTNFMEDYRYNINSCMFKITTHDLELKTKDCTHSTIKFRNLYRNREELSHSYEINSLTTTYIKNEKYLVKTNGDKGRELNISMLEPCDGLENCLNNIQITNKKMVSTILCSTLNSDQTEQNVPTKLISGMEKCAQVNNIFDENKQVLDTNMSDVYCVKFKPSDNDFSAYAGCKNKFLYSYDLRKNTKHYMSKYEHQSCVGGIVMDNNSSNNMISCDFTGQIYVWDLRMNKTISKYFDYRNKCSIKLSKCGNYLISVSKEGNVNVWNLKTSGLIKTIKSPTPTSRYEISYAEVPVIDLSINSKMFYSINNELYVYDI